MSKVSETTFVVGVVAQVREELVSLTPNNAVVVGEVEAELGQERLQEMLESKNLDARQVQVGISARGVSRKRWDG